MWPNREFSDDFVTFAEEILNGKLHFLCSAETHFIFVYFTLFFLNDRRLSLLGYAKEPSCVGFDGLLQLFDFFGNFLCDCQDQDIMSRSMTITLQTSWLLVLTLLPHFFKIPRTYLQSRTKCLEQNREIQ